ncbi:Origin recognition complex subunit 2 [Apophysomyces sp. BC1034]|nr:Origin recognition complex subunit 2 [Apophysomyces sp. BC1015]KAG0181538.1 Origin recognition complex subunit 2 [Apophysomyces sp. BC1021]KAG0192099.1 Origin recognition complex subunit 2 [Apophysomyces sp. BC1034]
MKIRIQDDNEIPIHIVSIVDTGTSQAEQSLAKQRKIRHRKARRTGVDMIADLGLTVDIKKTQTTVKEKNSTELVDDVTLLRKEFHEADQIDNDNDDDNDSIADKENKDLSGKAMFGFSYKKGSMMKKAMGDTEEQNDKEQPEAPRKRKRSKKTDASEDVSRMDHAKRRRMQRQVELLDDSRHSEEEEEEEEEEEGNNSPDEDEEGRDEEQRGDGVDGYERYFQDLHGSSKTSNNTLSKLAVLEPKEFHDILTAAPKKHKVDCNTLLMMHEQHFSQWFFEMHAGFNLLFYGYGSKRCLLNDFVQSMLTDGPVVVVNGFFPSITIKDILIKILVHALGLTATGQIQDQVALVCDYFSRKDRKFDRLYLAIHNIDGMNLRNERTQTALSLLASAPNIHLIGSVDHINSGLLWDNVKSSRFNWIWHDATTFDDYIVETSFENSLLTRTGDIGGARGVRYVLASLTSNARGVFRVLAENQLIEMELSGNEHARGNESTGLPYHRYYQLCREQFYVSNDLALRSQLTEFRDHKIINSKRLVDGTEVFYIPLDKSILCSIIENMT